MLRMTGALLLAAGFSLPGRADAQVRISGGRDLDRAVRLGALVYGVAREVERETGSRRREPAGTGRAGGRPRTTAAGTGRSAGSSRVGTRAVENGERYLGVRYKWGGNTPSEGFDCSGFVKYVYARNDVTLPRNSRQQSQVGQWLPVKITALRQGDLMFFASDGRRIDHVAMYAGGNRIIHSSSSGGGVLYDDLGSRRGKWFVDHFVAARRVSDDGGSLVDALLAARLAFDYFDPPDRAPRLIR